MTHHHQQEEEKSNYSVYYLVGILSGLFAGVTLEGSWVWIPVLGVFGLLFTAFFVSLLVKGRESH
jgi:hypothetical protein